MLVREVARVVVQGPTKVRSSRLAALGVPFALVATLTTMSWAAPVDPIPVKDNASVAEGAPTSHGAWLGWVQNSRRKLDHHNFFVQRGTQARVRVNAAKTQGLGGGILGHHVYYAQQFRDRHPQIVRLDLETGHRRPLPSKVNHYHHTVHLPCCGGQDDKNHVLSGVRGNVTVSGSWLLYSGYMQDLDHDEYPYYMVMLYNRVKDKLRQLASALSDDVNYYAGQVNGRYATYWSFARYGGSDVYRYNIRTRRSVALPHGAGGDQYDPAVSSDGTVYYFVTDEDAPSGGPYTTELVRQPIGATAEVVTTLTSESRDTPRETYVKDRPNGTRVVFFSWKDDVYKLVDDPQPAISGRR
jgi:hypothetical protein